MNLKEVTADKLVSLYRKRAFSVTEVITDLYAQIEKADTKIHAFITLCKDRALDEARRMDSRLATGDEIESLAGVPVAIKDNIAVRDIPMTCGSRILEKYIPPYSATAVERLRRSGAIVIGKTNLDEFAMGSSTENSAFFETRNPHDLDRVPGGSSGGSAASVAAGMSLLALGSDTGGSIRQPASFCGVVGVKPTYGRISRYGLTAFASSLDQIGPFAKTVREAAQLLEIMSGPDPLDSTSSDRIPEEIVKSLEAPIRDIRIGVPREYFEGGLDSEVLEAIQASIRACETLGCSIEDIRLPHTEYAVATYSLIASAEASSNLARFDGVRYGRREEASGGIQDMYRKTRTAGLGKEVKRRILLGTYALSAGYYEAYYERAMKVRARIMDDFRQAFEKVDVILTPTTPTVAFKIGEKTSDPLTMYLSDVFNVPCNLAGLPGISIPCGRNSEGLPIGLQLLANHFQEPLLLRVAAHFERRYALR